MSERELKRLQVIQNSLARLVCKQSKFSHATPLLKSLHWLPVKYRIDYKSCLLIFKTIKFHTPSYFTQWFIPYSCSVNMRHSLVSKHFLNEVAFDRKIHQSKTCFDGIFSVRGPQLWNSLPLDLCVSENVDSFKSKLKTYFFLQGLSSIVRTSLCFAGVLSLTWNVFFGCFFSIAFILICHVTNYFILHFHKKKKKKTNKKTHSLPVKVCSAQLRTTHTHTFRLYYQIRKG